MRNALLGLSVMGSALWAALTAAQQNPGAELGRIVPYSEEELRERERSRPDASQTADEILRNAETFRQQTEREATELTDKYTAPANPSSAVGARMRASIDPSSLLGQGIALRNNLEMYKAMLKLEEAARATPNDAKVHIYLADTYYRLSKQAEGKAEEARALQLDPNVMEIFR